MVFSSILFILYFLPVFLLTYYLVGIKYKNLVILCFSIFFYAWGAPKFVFVLLGTTFLDYYLVRLMYKVDNEKYKRIYLALSVIINVGLLCYFKYSNFFIDNINHLLSIAGYENVHWIRVVLPIGISFYTFETITYVIDVYRGVHKPLNNFWNYQLYIMLFPKLIAGPIVRYHDLADQIDPVKRSENDTLDNKLIGFYRFVIGLAKKILIANQLGMYADSVLTMDFANLDTVTAWTGILAYTFQIYFDFSGYSDMAIGISRMIGFRIPENFMNPYTSSSVTEFWRRWHISLGNWMKYYLYIPLGGNRVNSKYRLYFNLWVVFLISGLWHGAEWNFVIWGAYHGVFLILERMFLLKIYERVGRILSTFITFIIIVIGWVFFRIEGFNKAILFLKDMFRFHCNENVVLDSKVLFVFALAIIFSFFTMFKVGLRIQNGFYVNQYTVNRHYLTSIISLLLLILCISVIAAFGFNPFIYFRF